MSGLQTFAQLLDHILSEGQMDIRWTHEYAEPGYSQEGPGILFANWNPVRFDAPTKADRFMPRLADLAEHYGYAIEWNDEWTVCDDCDKAIRTSADSYSWKPSFWMDGCGHTQCIRCAQDNPEHYLEYLSGNCNTALTFPLDLKEHGYHQLEQTYESGWHLGQTDDPEKVAAELELQGISDYIFQITDTGQFDMRFRVWVKTAEDESHG